MSLQPTPTLAAEIASLCCTAPPGAGRRITSKSLEALIAAIFARIFARLEAILRLWQSGTLPAMPQRAPHPRTQQSPANRRSAPSASPRAPARTASPDSPGTAATRMRRPRPHPAIIRYRGIRTAVSRPRPASRDPPAQKFRFPSPTARPPSCAAIVPLSKL